MRADQRFLEPHPELHGSKPVEEVVRLGGTRPCALRQRGEARLRVTAVMVIEDVVAGPQSVVGRHGHDDRSVRLQELEGASHDGNGTRHVLENVQEQDQRIAVLGRKRLVELTSCDAVAPRAVGADGAFIRLDAFDLAEPLKLVEEKAIAAPDVENLARQPSGQGSLDHIEHERLPCSPPPVIAVERRVSRDVLRIHRRLPWWCAFTMYCGRLFVSS